MNRPDTSSILGPSTMGTLLCGDGMATVRAYCEYLHQSIAVADTISPELAQLWGSPVLAGQPYWLLQNLLGETWLRIIESPGITAPQPLRQTGWLSLEVSVQNVDALAASLAGSPFTELRPPANLELSDKIRATQVAGPVGEVLYLTEIKGEVPPFELSGANCAVDKLFIPVLCCHDREASTAFYETLAGRTALRFDTKITVVNQAYNYELEHQHPVATVQLAGDTLIEIDEIEAATSAFETGSLSPGIAMISFEYSSPAGMEKLMKKGASATIAEAPYFGRQVTCMRGAAGELIELLPASR